MSKQSYDFLFGVLKGFENREPDGLSKFNFSAHGRDQNIRFKLYQGRLEIGSLRFIPVAEDTDLSDSSFKLVTDQLSDNIMAKYASFGKYKEASLRTVKALFDGFVGRVLHRSLTVMPNRIVMEAVLVDGEDLMPDGRVILDMKVLEKTQHELQMEALKEHMAKMRQRQEEGLPVHRLGEPDPMAEEPTNAVKEPEVPEGYKVTDQMGVRGEVVPVDYDAVEKRKPIVSGLEVKSSHDSLTSMCRAEAKYNVVDRREGVTSVSPDDIPTV